jgi:serine O-acetyltransferase
MWKRRSDPTPGLKFQAEPVGSPLCTAEEVPVCAVGQHETRRIGRSECEADTMETGDEMTFWDLVKTDLQASTGFSSRLRAFSAFVFNPGFSTVFLHRLAVKLKAGPFRRLGIIVWRWNVSRSGCHIHLDSKLGPGLMLPHPVGIVIGAGAEIGANATIFQTVTVGKAGKSETYPVIGDDVTIYPNAVVIGPIRVGNRAVIGAASVVVKDVPDDAIVAGNPARVLRIAAGAQ